MPIFRPFRILISSFALDSHTINHPFTKGGFLLDILSLCVYMPPTKASIRRSSAHIKKSMGCIHSTSRPIKRFNQTDLPARQHTSRKRNNPLHHRQRNYRWTDCNPWRNPEQRRYTIRTYNSGSSWILQPYTSLFVKRSLLSQSMVNLYSGITAHTRFLIQ